MLIGVNRQKSADGTAAGNALAHSDLARALIHKGWYTAVPSRDIVPKAKAAALAALLQERDRMASKKVAVVVSGGNIDRDLYLDILGAPDDPVPAA